MTHQITTRQQNQKLVLVEKIPIERNPAAVYLVSLSQSGRRTQRAALDKIAGMLTGGAANAFTCNWAAVRYEHATAIRALLAETYAPATANKMLSALRRVLKEAWKLDGLSAEDYHRASSVENVKGETLPSGRELNKGEITSLMTVCQNDPGPAGVRDAAMIALLYSWGLNSRLITTKSGEYINFAMNSPLRDANIEEIIKYRGPDLDDFNYDNLEIKDKVFIKKLDYEASGAVSLDDKTTLDLNNDNLIIERFYGDLKIENKRFKIQGYLESLDVEGDQQISVSV